MAVRSRLPAKAILGKNVGSRNDWRMHAGAHHLAMQEGYSFERPMSKRLPGPQTFLHAWNILPIGNVSRESLSNTSAGRRGNT